MDEASKHERGVDLGWFFFRLRYEDRSKRRNFQNLRLLLVWGNCVTGKEKCTVADIFEELPGLECFEAMMDDVRCTRDARDGTTRVVRWRCQKNEAWRRDWAKGVSTVDPDSPLILFSDLWCQ
ncbi:hypothetical protein PC9H_000008 [Pleurotus ostreatus]|uniref:Uncharacterized protein n=1 Tax=Pleurotus ostreatus TaxID=5322 RepID=A0A8H7DW83_PLEOS|nr:uncharacterized protein PC9H_009052 [Pleurotus ostreatus]XP_036635516.1 uncharacterized protein PC9H_000008 [Pleurotus ostreatus]KAF7426683.1 hypothetical protein PC9H_009052 [Pleurotus ostreatus]KAF7439672.1 hypothetical protein PC9H_000008 [Pleurotus ostreatus]